MSWYRWEGKTLLLQVRVQARASRPGLGAVRDERLRLRVSSPPVDGRANAEIVALVAGAFGVAKSRVRIRRGIASREQEVEVRAPTRYPAGLSLQE